MSQSGTFQPSWEGPLDSPNDSFRGWRRHQAQIYTLAANDAKQPKRRYLVCGPPLTFRWAYLVDPWLGCS